MSLGHQIARALATHPQLILLDEPAAGMNDSETEVLRQLIGKIRDLGITVVVIEHDMALMMNICDRLAVLNFGKKIAEGTPQENLVDLFLASSILGISKLPRSRSVRVWCGELLLDQCVGESSL